MKKFGTVSLFVTILYLIHGNNLLAGDSHEMLQPFEAVYRIEGWGVVEIQRTVTLSYDAPIYKMSLVNEVTGLASLTGYGPIVEESQFKLMLGSIKPIVYSNIDQSEISHLHDSIQFDWESGLARSQRKEERFIFPVEVGVLDPITVELSVRRDLIAGRPYDTYLVHDVEQIRTFQVSRLDNVTIDTELGSFEAIHLIIDTGRTSRLLHYWLAPDISYLPVQIIQYHNGKVEVQATIQKLSLK
ncbi:MAG: hypothetical protein CL398_00495 [Acidiferrobacteraceae bacterium]|nr:hypothetical protein [Acidiferrobacteraceae bacterium]